MRLRIPKFTSGSAIGLALAVAALAGAAAWTNSSHHLAKLPLAHQASQTPSPTQAQSVSPTATPSASSQPAVMGTSTQAPAPAAAKPAATAAHTSTPAPQTPAAAVQDTLVINGQKFTVNAANVTNACDILKQAKAEGKIASLTIYESTKYMASHGNSAYVYELNGLSDQWQYSATDSGGAPLPARGCSLTPVRPGYSVTWFTK